MNFPRLLIYLLTALIGVFLGWQLSSLSQPRAAGAQPPVKTPRPAARMAAVPEEKSSKPALLPAEGFALSWPALDSVDDCRNFLAALTQSLSTKHPLLARLERSYALRRWLELDAESALAEAEQRGDADFGGDLFRAWLNLNPGSALAAFTQASPALTAKLRDSFFEVLADKNPAQAAEELVKPRWRSKKSLAADTALATAYQKWAQRDPQAAVAHAEAHSPANSSPSLSQFVIQGWAQTDPAAAWSFFKQRLTSETSPNTRNWIFMDRDWIVRDIMAGALVSGPAGSLFLKDMRTSLKEQFNNIGSNGHLLSQIADWMVRADPYAALDWARGLPEGDSQRKETLIAAAGSLATAEPETALALLAETGGSLNEFATNHLLRQAFASLQASDPARAQELLASRPAEERSSAAAGILLQALNSGSAAALELAQNWLRNPNMKPAALSAWSTAFSWQAGSGLHDPGPMLQALPELNAAVNNDVLSTWAKTDPEAVADWIATRAANDPTAHVDKITLSEIAISRPEFAAGWITSLPEGEVRTNAARTLAANWSAFDPRAAEAWIASLPAGPLRKSAETARTEALAPAGK